MALGRLRAVAHCARRCWSCREQLQEAMGMKGAIRAGDREHEPFGKG